MGCVTNYPARLAILQWTRSPLFSVQDNKASTSPSTSGRPCCVGHKRHHRSLWQIWSGPSIKIQISVYRSSHFYTTCTFRLDIHLLSFLFLLHIHLVVMSLPKGHQRKRSSSQERRDPYSSPSIYYDEEAVRRQLLGSRNTRSVTSVGLLSLVS